jgi:hypothetical protein
MEELDPFLILTIVAALFGLLVYLRGVALVRAGMEQTGRLWGAAGIALVFFSAWLTLYGAWLFFLGAAAAMAAGLWLAHRR